jgi:uncharacterized membrane protein
MPFSILATALLFSVAGILHFVKADSFLKIMPSYVPWPLAMVYLSGAAEIAGGLGLLMPLLRPAAVCGLVVLLIAVFPANIQMALHPDGSIPPPLLWLRLPFQGVLIWWVIRLAGASGK